MLKDALTSLIGDFDAILASLADGPSGSSVARGEISPSTSSFPPASVSPSGNQNVTSAVSSSKNAGADSTEGRATDEYRGTVGIGSWADDIGDDDLSEFSFLDD